jgi:hypothetical protein
MRSQSASAILWDFVVFTFILLLYHKVVYRQTHMSGFKTAIESRGPRNNFAYGWADKSSLVKSQKWNHMCQWGKLENGKWRIIWLGLWSTLFTWTDGGAIAFLDIGTRTGASPVEWRWIRAQSSPFLSPATARVWLTRWRALRPRRPRRPTSVDCFKV